MHWSMFISYTQLFFFCHFIAVYVILCVLSRTKVDIAIATFIFKQQVLNETQVIQKIVDNRT